MRFISTRGMAPPVSFQAALRQGLAPDGGLYVPERVVPMRVETLRGASLAEIGGAVLAHLVEDEIARDALDRLVGSALAFPVPFVRLDDRTWVVELFHGPTMAFKDIGARVMARLLAHFATPGVPLTVLVATSGDTGSAVAQAFFGVPDTRVVVLYPRDGVTPVQAAQFTTLGGNVQAVAVAGTFDDCQRLAKEAFRDEALCRRVRLTSANSINIGRLLPQAFYYLHAALALGGESGVAFSVPTGNVGNLAAGVLALRLGAPIATFVAATTINDTLARYLETGRYEPRASVATLANAMDVGAPSNLERLAWGFAGDLPAIGRMVSASVHTDDEVRRAIRTVDERYGYVCDPHTAIGWLGLAAIGARAAPRVLLATAHPAKFRETVEPAIGRSLGLPAALAEALSRPARIVPIGPSLGDLRPILQTDHG
ncbi:MAG: threonine synthase [Acidobacteriota bacterium]